MVGALGVATAVLLAVSGLAKLRAPAPATAMITSLLPALRRRRLAPAVRLLGLSELAIGVAFLAIGGRAAAALLAGCYLGFLAVAVRLVGRHTPCGCFGATEAPVGIAHVLLNCAATAVATAAIVRPVHVLGGLPAHGSLVAAAGIGQAVLLVWLGYLGVTALPALLREVKP